MPPLRLPGFLLGAIVAFGAARPLIAWDGEGHMVAAQLAYNHLEPSVKARCDALIAVPLAYADSRSTTFVTASAWADDYKSSLGTSNWHYINLPISLDGTSTANVYNDPVNVVSAIRSCTSTLRSNTATAAEQVTALRYLIHLVADISQPLHCVAAVWSGRSTGDAGGNLFYLDGTYSNLHYLWDEGGGYLTDPLSRPLNSTEQATLDARVAEVEAAHPYTFSPGAIPDPMDWAVEGKGVAQTVTYVGVTYSSTPTAAYLDKVETTTKARLALAGQRLAKLLSSILVTDAAPVLTTSVANGNISVAWPSVVGRTYRVQGKAASSDTTWTDLTTRTATTTTTVHTESVAGRLRQYYRVLVVN